MDNGRRKDAQIATQLQKVQVKSNGQMTVTNFVIGFPCWEQQAGYSSLTAAERAPDVSTRVSPKATDSFLYWRSSLQHLSATRFN